jgi:hypothetical protein
MKKEKGKVTSTWLKARKLLKEEQFEQAEQTLDLGIALVAHFTLEGLMDKDLLEGVKMETWKERFWVATENFIWPRRPDYEKNWRFK